LPDEKPSSVQDPFVLSLAINRFYQAKSIAEWRAHGFAIWLPRHHACFLSEASKSRAAVLFALKI
jgi:hypothetical protein